MCDQPNLDEVEEDWEPVRQRRAGLIRLLAIVVVAAMVLALVIPALLRLLQDDQPEETRPDGVRAAVVLEQTRSQPQQAEAVPGWGEEHAGSISALGVTSGRGGT